MKHLCNTLLFILFVSATMYVGAAVKVVECEDETGARSFYKTCPPGTTRVGSKKLRTGVGDGATDNSDNLSAVLYLVPNCDTCEQVKEFLNIRNISVTEKNANEDLEIQNELTELTGGLKVPTTVIGDQVLSGYNRQDFLTALKAIGYTGTE